MEKNLINLFFVLTLLFLFMFLYSLWEKYWIQMKYYTIKVNKKSFNGFKIVFISDLHHSSIVSKKFIKNIVKKVNDMKPDLIILGGDYVSSEIKYIKPVFEILKTLSANKGIYGVLGNHDMNVSKNKILMAMEKAGIQSLDNQSYWIENGDERIKLGGVADFIYGHPKIENTIFDVLHHDYVILVSHNPDYVDEVKNLKIDLMLSGHTHGGQVTIFGMYAPYIPSTYKQRYRTGLKIVNRIQLIITNGVGVVGLPIRFFARPQIVVVKLNN